MRTIGMRTIALHASLDANPVILNIHSGYEVKHSSNVSPAENLNFKLRAMFQKGFYVTRPSSLREFATK
jgi:hypothetical protein